MFTFIGNSFFTECTFHTLSSLNIAVNTRTVSACWLLCHHGAVMLSRAGFQSTRFGRAAGNRYKGF